MNEVLPSPHTRVSAPTRPRDQPSPRPSAANKAQAPKKVIHMVATGNHSCAFTCTFGTSCSTSAGSAILITHQLMPCTVPAGGRAGRCTSRPSRRQANSRIRAVIGTGAWRETRPLVSQLRRDLRRPGAKARWNAHNRRTVTRRRHAPMSDTDALVIGAGPAGLACAAMLGEQGLRSVILEKAATVGAVWRRHSALLPLHTARVHSGLPGLPMPRDYPRYPSRAQVQAVVVAAPD